MTPCLVLIEPWLFGWFWYFSGPANLFGNRFLDEKSRKIFYGGKTKIQRWLKQILTDDYSIPQLYSTVFHTFVWTDWQVLQKLHFKTVKPAGDQPFQILIFASYFLKISVKLHNFFKIGMHHIMILRYSIIPPTQPHIS